MLRFSENKRKIHCYEQWIFLCVKPHGIRIQPFIFNDNWVIEKDGISVKEYSSGSIRKTIELITKNQRVNKIYYMDMSSAEIIYQHIQRMSLYDFSPDAVYLKVTMHNGVEIKLNSNNTSMTFLPQFIAFLQRQHIQVTDNHAIVQELIAKNYLVG